MLSKEEKQRLVDGFAQSGMTRRKYCEKHNLPVTTFDYWRHVRKRRPRLVEVALETHPAAGFTLVLANGRRIESSWKFAEADLLRLIRTAEA
jgi:transposase-like protein